jgi:hypothetical protein
LIFDNKKFGISSSLRQICAICVPKKIPFFEYDWKSEIWNIFFLIGILLGGIIASQFLTNPNEIIVAESTKTSLAELGITDFSKLLPVQIFSVENILTLRGFIFFVLGGFLVGFGTRWAGGCTSGHAIMGLSNMQLPSFIATCCFMAGGFFSTNILLPIILKFM